MVESYFQTLLVIQTHLMNSIFVDYLLLIVSELSQELVEYSSDPLNDIWFLHPYRYLTLDIFIIEVLVQVLIIIVVSFPHHLQLLCSHLSVNHLVC